MQMRRRLSASGHMQMKSVQSEGGEVSGWPDA